SVSATSPRPWRSRPIRGSPSRTPAPCSAWWQARSAISPRPRPICLVPCASARRPRIICCGRACGSARETSAAPAARSWPCGSPIRSTSSRIGGSRRSAWSTLRERGYRHLVGCAIDARVGVKAVDDYQDARRAMVAEQLATQGITCPRVLAAMRDVPRHLFVPRALLPQAYDDTALGIDCGQTISQPYIVARMTEALELPAGEPLVLEVGTGSGYQAAVLATLGARVVTVEWIPALAERARAALEAVGV